MMYGMLVAVIALGVPPAVLLWQDYQRRRAANKKLDELSGLAASLQGKDPESLTPEQRQTAQTVLTELRDVPYMLLREHRRLWELWRARRAFREPTAESGAETVADAHIEVVKWVLEQLAPEHPENLAALVEQVQRARE